MAKTVKTAVDTNKVSTDGAVIARMIDNIKTASASLKTKISIAAASCVMHAIKHGDITLGLSLITALSEAEGDKKGATPWRTNALRDWFVAEGPFSVVENAKGKKELQYDDAKAKKLTKIMSADEARFGTQLVRNPFWLAKPEPEYAGFDFDAELAKLRARAKKAAAEKDEAKKAKIKMGSFEAFEAAAANGFATEAVIVH
jgi:hypothetical protein